MEFAKCSDRYSSGRHQHRLCGHQRRELLVEADFVLHVLRHRLDDEVSVCNRLRHIEFEVSVLVRRFHLLKAFFRVEAVEIRDTVRPICGRLTVRRCHQVDGVDVHLMQVVKFGLCAPDAALTAQPNGHVESAVCALESNLAAQHTAARYHHFTNHQKISLLVNRAHLAQMVSF